MLVYVLSDAGARLVIQELLNGGVRAIYLNYMVESNPVMRVRSGVLSCRQVEANIPWPITIEGYERHVAKYGVSNNMGVNGAALRTEEDAVALVAAQDDDITMAEEDESKTEDSKIEDPDITAMPTRWSRMNSAATATSPRRMPMMTWSATRA